MRKGYSPNWSLRFSKTGWDGDWSGRNIKLAYCKKYLLDHSETSSSWIDPPLNFLKYFFKSSYYPPPVNHDIYRHALSECPWKLKHSMTRNALIDSLISSYNNSGFGGDANMFQHQEKLCIKACQDLSKFIDDRYSKHKLLYLLTWNSNKILLTLME